MKQKIQIEVILEVISRQPCILCGKPSVVSGFFTPDNPKGYGAQQGQTRMIFYSLCQDCLNSEDTQERVEKVAEWELCKKRQTMMGPSPVLQ